MNRKNRLKRKEPGGSKKKAERIRKGISIGLGLIFAAFIGFIVIRIREADRIRALAETTGVDSSPIAMNRGRDYGEAGFQKVAENEKLILCADFTTGEISLEEKNTGKIWYSNPIDREEEGIQGKKNNLASQIILTYFDVKTEKETSMDNFSGSIRLGGMDYEFVENGVKFLFSYPASGIIIPIQYTLYEDGFAAEILSDEIQELWSEQYVVLHIDLLPFFGAGGLSDEGYLFVPDGSGALIAFNSEKYTFGQYTEEIYGNDSGLKSVRETSLKEGITMPVFGLKCNDSAFLAVVTSGESNGVIYSYVSRKTTSYNQVYSRAIYRDYSTKGAGANMNASDENKRANDYSDNLLRGHNYSVRYFFLEEEADYTAMSRVYRTYLESENLLNDSELAEKNYLILDLYGAVSIQKYVMGIKRSVVTPLTTYNEVCDIVKEVKSRGVDNLIINYVGALNGGMENLIVDEVKTESCLGTKKEFEMMIQYLEEEGVELFLETDPIRFYEDGNGYKRTRDAVKTFFDGYATDREYAPNRKSNIAKSKSWYLLTPQLVPDVLERFTSSALTWGIRNISVYGIGETAYTDLAKTERFTPRADSVDLWMQTMEEIKDQADYLMVHEGNLYCAAYADVISDVAISGSDYDVEEASIPFYQMTLHGNIVMGTDAINNNADYHYAFLKALETGCSLKYNLMAADVTELVGTEYNDLVSYSYEYWLDTAIEQYQKLNEAYKGLEGQTMVYHEQIAENVSRTVYESGTSILVNYSEEAYQYGEYIIEGRGYLVVGGGEQ